MTDPTHSLYQRRFDLVSVPSRDSGRSYVTVCYRGSLSLRIPPRCTSLSDLVQHAVRSKITADAARELLALVKECESCARQPRKSGRTSRPKRGRKSSKNSTASYKRQTDEQIAAALTVKGHRAPDGGPIKVCSVRKLRFASRVLHFPQKSNPPRKAGYLTPSQVAEKLHIRYGRLYYYIEEGKIAVKKDAVLNC